VKNEQPLEVIPTYTGTTVARGPYVVISFDTEQWIKHRKTFKRFSEAETWASKNCEVGNGNGYMILEKAEATTDYIQFQLQDV